MSETMDHSIDNIETNIMSILYANMDVKFTQFSLFNKLLIDKYDIENTKIIHQNFKAKYLLVIRNLMSKYDDILITKNDKIYSILCVSSKEKTETCAEYIYNNDYLIKEDDINLSKYIVENDIMNEFKYIDPCDGNTIYHDLVLSDNLEIVEKMITDGTFNFFVFNKRNQTPLELSTNKLISNIIVMGIYNKIVRDNEKYMVLSSYIEILESDKNRVENIENASIFEIIKIKSKKMYYDNKKYFNIFLLLFIIYTIYYKY